MRVQPGVLTPFKSSGRSNGRARDPQRSRDEFGLLAGFPSQEVPTRTLIVAARRRCTSSEESVRRASRLPAVPATRLGETLVCAAPNAIGRFIKHSISLWLAGCPPGRPPVTRAVPAVRNGLCRVWRGRGEEAQGPRVARAPCMGSRTRRSRCRPTSSRRRRRLTRPTPGASREAIRGRWRTVRAPPTRLAAAAVDHRRRCLPPAAHVPPARPGRRCVCWLLLVGTLQSAAAGRSKTLSVAPAARCRLPAARPASTAASAAC